MTNSLHHITDSLYYGSSADRAEPTRYARLTRPSFFRGSGTWDYMWQSNLSQCTMYTVTTHYTHTLNTVTLITFWFGKYSFIGLDCSVFFIPIELICQVFPTSISMYRDVVLCSLSSLVIVWYILMTDDFSSGNRDSGDYLGPVPHVHEYWSDQFNSQWWICRG